MNLLLTILAAGALVAPPADYPKPVDDFVNDFADVLPAETEARVREIAKAIRSEKGIPIVVVVVQSLADYDAADWSVERYATNLYNEWGIGSAETNQGVLLFVAVRDRKLRIAVGAGFAASFDGPARSIIDRRIVPRFKAGDHPGGVLAGVEGIAEALRRGPERGTHGGEGETWTPRGTGVGAPIRGGRSGSSFGWILLGGLGLLFVLALVSIARGAGGGGWLSSAGGRGWGGWGGLLWGGLGGFLGSWLYDRAARGRTRGSSGSGDGGGGFSWGGPSSWGGGTSSFGGGFSAGGGASGSW